MLPFSREIFSDKYCDLGLLYHLQPGKRYSVIAAMNATSDTEAYFGRGNADKVLFFASKPTAILTPDTDDPVSRRDQAEMVLQLRRRRLRIRRCRSINNGRT